MENIDKAIEIIKAAEEKEMAMQDKTKESLKQSGEEETQALDLESQEFQETADLEEGEPVNEEEDECPQGAKLDKQMKSFFKGGKSKEIAAKDVKIEELTDRLMRNMAEFDNFRKRSEKEKSQMYDIGVKSVIEKLLPVIDNFERGLGAISDKEKENAFAQGIEMIYRQLMTTIDEIGVKPIEAVGNEFDPNLHNAVMHGEDESMDENTISDEFQKGYLYRDMVIRHSMVKVVN